MARTLDRTNERPAVGSATPISAAHLARLDGALRRHLMLLRKLLLDEERDAADLHLQVAGQLRVLLCDADVPILLAYAAAKGLSLRIWGPNPPGFDARRVLFQMTALVASAHPVPESYEMTIETYLDTVVGVVALPVQVGSVPQSIAYTPRQLIKWVANKEGVAHLDLNPPAGLTAIQGAITTAGSVSLVGGDGSRIDFGATDQFLVRSSILQIAQWAERAIEAVLHADPLQVSPKPDSPEGRT